MATDQSSPFELRYDAWGRLVLVDAAGVQHVGVESLRDFPITDPKHWISLVDAQGRELMQIDDPEQLPAETRKLLEDDLARREFVPVIQSIERISSDDPTEWTVVTDRGPATFLVKSEEDIRRLGRHRALVVDAYGIRYFIADIKRLDPASRRWVDRYL